MQSESVPSLIAVDIVLFSEFRFPWEIKGLQDPVSGVHYLPPLAIRRIDNAGKEKETKVPSL
jgi:hypothetical protein